MKRAMLFLLACGAVAVALGSTPAGAHHRLSDTYVETREVTIIGEVTKWESREPHSFVLVEIPAGPNRTERWIVEAPGASAWRRAGVGPHVLTIGDRVTVTGHPGRVPAERRLFLTAISRPQDGWRWSAK
jgi:hypothetical protein